MATRRNARKLAVWRRVIGSPPLWLMLALGGAVVAACGSSDEHRAAGDSGGASGQAGQSAGAGRTSDAGQTSSEAGQSSSDSGGGSNDPTGGSSAAAGESSRSDIGGEATLVGGNGSEPDGAGGAGGASADGCLSLHFDKDSDTLQIPDLTIPDFGNAGTIELWLLPDEGQPDVLVAGGCLFNKWVNFQEDKFFYLNGDGSLSAYFAQQAANFSSTPAVKPLKWQHVALAYDGTSARIYVDGTKVGEQVGAGPPVNSNGNIQVGHVVRDTTYPALHGYYSELRLSNVARYTTTFTPAAHLTADASTTGLWAMDEGSGTTAADASGLGNPGTIDGAEWQLAPCR